MTFGLTPAGFTPKTTQDVLNDIETDEANLISATLDVSADQPVGQLNGIFAAKAGEIWELVGELVGMFSRGNAEGAILDNTGDLTGTPRDPPTATVVDVTVNLNAGTTLPLGTKACVAGFPLVTFSIQAPVTNSGGSPADFPAVFVCDTDGPNVVNPSTFTQILTPVTGWNTITNSAAGTPGSNVETDTAYRVRQVQDLFAQGSSDLDSIIAAVSKVTGVIQVIGFENDTLVIDPVTLLPGKSFEIVLWDGPSPAASNQDIVNAIWSQKPSGIQSYGSSSHTIVDAQGVTRAVFFTRATQVPIYFELDIHELTGYAGDTAVKAAVAAYALATQRIGTSVLHLAYQALPLVQTGVGDVPTCKLGVTASPTGQVNLTMGIRQIATVSTTNITIVSV